MLDDWSGVLKDGWRSPQILLLLFAASIPIAFETWSVLINNFVVEKAGFTGREIGILQGLREVPGFLAFTAVFMLLVWRQQTFAIVSLAVMGVGVAMAGFLPSVWGLYFTTVLMSTGFHYLATMEQSLAMQWTSERELPVVLGRMTAVASLASLVTYGLVFGALTLLDLTYLQVFLAGGGLTVGIAALCRFGFPHFATPVHQTTAIVLRRRYWLYYALEFMSGARRQIFVVFAAFMMVETFGYAAEDITLLFLVNCLISIWVAPRVGRLIVRWGERSALVVEYVGPRRRVHRLRLRPDGVAGGGSVHRRSPVLRARHRDQELLPQDCRRFGHRLDRGSVADDQPRRRGRPAADPRSRVGDGRRGPHRRVPARRRHRGGFTGPGPARPERAGPGQRDGTGNTVEKPHSGMMASGTGLPGRLPGRFLPASRSDVHDSDSASMKGFPCCFPTGTSCRWSVTLGLVSGIRIA